MPSSIHRRHALKSMAAALGAGVVGSGLAIAPPRRAQGAMSRKVRDAVKNGMEWLVRNQSRSGHWDASNTYRVPMTALAGTAMLCEGSTTTQGKYCKNISRAADYLIGQSIDKTGLIGIPSDGRYTYGHGFSMLFLSQVLGDEEDEPRREQLVKVLTKAVEFSGRAQTDAGGWGYVSSRDGGGFDEGSTTVTQVQGLRGCRNAGIPVDKKFIDNAIKYIHDCQMADGGICYSSKSRGGSRPAITAAAIATLFNAGEYKGETVEKMTEYCKRTLSDVNNPQNASGHWYYTYYYYAQAMYRMGGDEWDKFSEKLTAKLLRDQASDGSWSGEVGQIYATALSLTILQLENAYLPIYQR